MPSFPALFDLTGRVAVVTGGAGLLGAQFCRTLAEAGARVVLADIDREAAVRSAASISVGAENSARDGSTNDWQVIPLHLDVRSQASVSGFFGEVQERFSRVDVLVNSAALDPKFDPGNRPSGAGLLFAFEEYPLQAWQEALEVNLSGAFLCCQAAGKAMLMQGGGVMVNICSIYGIVGPDQRIYQKPGQELQYKPAYYSVTKAGLLGLTRYLATYYAGKNIRVNSLTPGGVFNDHDVAFVQAYSARAVLGRMAQPDELNGALLFLASDASSYMTGANLVVDGGWTAW